LILRVFNAVTALSDTIFPTNQFIVMNSSEVRASERSRYGMSSLLNYKVGRTETRNHMIDLHLLDRVYNVTMKNSKKLYFLALIKPI
jgi:hypothetical protein